MQDNQPFLTATHGADGRLIAFSVDFAAMFGIGQESLGAMPPFPWWPDESIASIEAAMKYALRTPTRTVSEVELVIPLEVASGKIASFGCRCSTVGCGIRVLLEEQHDAADAAASPSRDDTRRAVELIDHIRRTLGLEALETRPESMAVLSRISDLSSREQTVLAHLVDGHRTAEIADLLNISPHTVRNHRKSIFTKLQVSSQVELMALVHKQDLSPLLLENS